MIRFLCYKFCETDKWALSTACFVWVWGEEWELEIVRKHSQTPNYRPLFYFLHMFVFIFYKN